jgi:ribose transport system substrate-binding protein
MLDTPEAASAYKSVIDQGAKAINYEKLSRILHPDDWDPQWPIRHFEPDTFWAENQNIPKPAGYELPEDYQASVDAGGYEKIDKLYLDHFKSFPFKEAVEKSRNKETAFQTVYGLKYNI